MNNLNKNDYFINFDNRAKVKDYFDKVIEMGLDFKINDSLINRKDEESLKKYFLKPLSDEGISLENMLEEFQHIINHSTNFSSKRFMAFPDAGNAISSVLASILIPLLNQNLINADHCSPVGSFVEMAVINWTREVLGFEVNYNPKNIMEVGGIITSGGTISNTIALMAARDKVLPSAKDFGVRGAEKPLKLLVPKYISHYSQRCSMAWLGLGEKNITEIEITDDLIMDLNDLKQKIKDLSQDYKIMAIACYAGDSRAMSIDNLEAISDIAHQNDIWFHVDACHGFQFAFSDKLKSNIKGIETADSVTMDPHKVLAIPYVISALAFKNANNFKYVASNSDLIMKEDYAFGQITPMLGSRAFNSLKMWSMIKNFGRKNIGEFVEKRHELACYLFDKLNKDDDFVVINKKVGINSVIFMYKGKFKDLRKIDVDKLNVLNKKIYETAFNENQYYLHNFPFPDLRHLFSDGIKTLCPLRFMCGNYLTSTKDVDNMIEAIRKLGRRFE